MDEIKRAAAEVQGEAVAFLRELIRIPSPSGREGEVIEAVRKKMEAVGFDEVRIDPFGNVLARENRVLFDLVIVENKIDMLN